ncbi:MAG TPA: hypothetical protein VGZ73_22490, partial [Bryobacteraceae bacterium]|nr:hypothetical protein [Bryobacteraceae bacterium]
AFALLFRPDIVKISLDSEAALLLREAANEPLQAGVESAAVPAAPSQGSGPHFGGQTMVHRRT